MTNPSSQFVWQGDRIYHLGAAAAEVSPRMIVVGDPARALRVAARFDRIDHEVRHREFVTLTGPYGGRPCTVIGTGIGTDNLEIALMEAWALLAVDHESGETRADLPAIQVVRVGTSGGARADLAPGTLCIAGYGLGLDSTGLYHDIPAVDEHIPALEAAALATIEAGTAADARFRGWLRPYASRADPALVDKLAKAAAAGPSPSIVGITVGAPGFYAASGRFVAGLRNTVAEIKERLGEIEIAGMRVCNFDMESSLLFHLAAGLNIRAATISPVISAPGSHGKVVDFRPLVEQAIDLALQSFD